AAYEMAQPLVAAGAEVRLVALIDQRNPNPTVPPTWGPRTLINGLKNLLVWVRHELPFLTAEELRGRSRRKLAHYARKLRRRWTSRGRGPSEPDARENFDLEAMSPRYREYLAASFRALRRYVPRPYPGRGRLVRAQAQSLTGPHHRDLGWEGLAQGGLEVRIVPGGHNLLREPFVARVAAELRDALDRAERAEGRPGWTGPPGRFDE